MSSYYRNRRLAVIEFGPGASHDVIHVVPLRALGKGGRNELLSAEAFRTRMAKRYPNIPYSLNFPRDFLSLRESYRRVERTVGERFPRPKIVKHADLWSFYKAIGYDRKRDRFILKG